MKISIPPGIEPRRVSVDAIEHWMIYREHPEVGAILHVHAWVDGVDATQVNFPCGTAELAESVAELVREAPDPAHAIIGLKNHGLTITGLRPGRDLRARRAAHPAARADVLRPVPAGGTCPERRPSYGFQSMETFACAEGEHSGGAGVEQM